MESLSTKRKTAKGAFRMRNPIGMETHKPQAVYGCVKKARKRTTNPRLRGRWFRQKTTDGGCVCGHSHLSSALPLIQGVPRCWRCPSKAFAALGSSDDSELTTDDPTKLTAEPNRTDRRTETNHRGGLADEEAIAWIAPIGHLPYVRETTVPTSNPQRRPSKPLGVRWLVGYAIHGAQSSAFERRVFVLKTGDYSGLYGDPTEPLWPAEAVDPATVAPGVPGESPTPTPAETQDELERGGA